MDDAIDMEGHLDDIDLTQLRARADIAPQEVLQEAHGYLAKDPRNAALLRIAAVAHRALGAPDNAERAEIAAIDAVKDCPELVEASRLIDLGEAGEASRIVALYLQHNPDDLRGLTLSAEAALALGLPDKAIPLLENVLARAPSYLLARTLLINALSQIDRLRDARLLLEPVVRRMPGAIRFHELMAKIAGNQGDYATAIQAGRAVVELDPQTAENWVNHGDNLRFAGRTGEAKAAYRRAIEVMPDHGRAWWSLADIDASELNAEDRQAVERAIMGRAGDPEHLCNLHFALGIDAHARGEHAEAFANFARGNEVRRSVESDEPGLVSRQVDRYLAELGAEDIPVQIDPRPGEPTPIFLVGMPRSGSTLVERILGSHSQIEALGELAIVPHMVDRLKRDVPDGEVSRAVLELPAEHLSTMGRWYVARGAELMTSEPRRHWFTDKMHMNWRHLPLILRILPQARVIDVRRNAMDCCWSNYRTLFARGHPAANDLADIGHFYRDYVRFTDTLRTLAPGRIHLLRYESLFDDFEGEISRLLAALGLAYEPMMADFHLSEAPVATASSEQVRQPLNRRGLGSWRPYAQWLDPMREALGDLAEG